MASVGRKCVDRSFDRCGATVEPHQPVVPYDGSPSPEPSNEIEIGLATLVLSVAVGATGLTVDLDDLVAKTAFSRARAHGSL